MDVAFLASSRKTTRYQQDPAFIYRCENLGHALRAKSLNVAWGHSLTWRIPPSVGCVVVHRPRVSFRLWRLVRRLKSMGTRLVADLDDLVFDESLAEYSPAVRNGREPLWRQQRLFREHRGAIKWFDHVTVSTDALCQHVHRCFPGKPVTVVHNAVHWHWRRELQGMGERNAQSARRVLTYLPGTRSHDRDFSMIAGPLSQFLRFHPEVELRITGPLNCRLDVPPRQVRHGDKVAFANYHQQFDGVWVNLAPLEDTPFNACKSALKALEAGYWGIPTICSPNPDYQRYTTAGAMVASSPEDWLQALERLTDEDQYRLLHSGLRERTLHLADVEQCASRFVDQVLARTD